MVSTFVSLIKYFKISSVAYSYNYEMFCQQGDHLPPPPPPPFFSGFVFPMPFSIGQNGSLKLSTTVIDLHLTVQVNYKPLTWLMAASTRLLGKQFLQINENQTFQR